METVFHKIIRTEIPCHKVYEDEHTLAFLDINPQAKGHTLVVPKKFVETILDLEPQDLSHIFIAVQRVTKRIQTVLRPDGFTIGWNHGRAGGQAIPYLHVHIFPRWHSDGGTSIHAAVNNPGDMTVSEVATLFKSNQIFL
ncbi:MAG: HIT family protein [Candidatus Magasanikbacteria bacterium]|nr:HIT family protein [Candidatus Magasanikbacteria bacterium]